MLTINTEDQQKHFEKTDSDFMSDGTRCAGWLYLPQKHGTPSVVIMAHGFAGERSFGLPAYAIKFVQNGFGVFLFDYRHFGDSDGEPRNLVDPAKQCQDWQAALNHIRSLDSIDSERIALWGTSLSGGHVICTASHNPGIRAIISQLPYLAPNRNLFQFSSLVKTLIAGIRDIGREWTRRDPYYIPVVGKPGTLALLNTPECMEGYRKLIPPHVTWENRVPARMVFKASLYKPLRFAKHVNCPSLLIAAKDDSLIPHTMVKKAAAEMPDARYEELPCNHFEPYYGEFLQQITGLEVTFLSQYL